jgi:hypothetical protein
MCWRGGIHAALLTNASIRPHALSISAVAWITAASSATSASTASARARHDRGDFGAGMGTCTTGHGDQIAGRFG